MVVVSSFGAMPNASPIGWLDTGFADSNNHEQMVRTIFASFFFCREEWLVLQCTTWLALTFCKGRAERRDDQSASAGAEVV